MFHCRIILLATLLTGSVGFAFAQEDEAAKAQKIIDKAIKAKGGKKAIAKTAIVLSEDEGTYYGGGMDLPYSGAYVVDQKKKRYRMEIEGIFTTVSTMKGGWTSMNGEVTDTTDIALKAAKEELLVSFAMSFLPLRKPNKKFKLALAGTEEVEGEKCDGVKVSSKGMPDLTLFISQKTGMLKKTSYMTRLQEQDYKLVKDETVYHSYKEFDGVQYATSLTVTRGGEKFVETKITKVSFPKSVDDSKFEKP